MNNQKTKSVTVKVLRGFMFHGKKVLPISKVKTGTGKDEKEKDVNTVISLPSILAGDLIAGKKVEISKEKPNTKISEPDQDDGLSEAFGED